MPQHLYNWLRDRLSDHLRPFYEQGRSPKTSARLMLACWLVFSVALGVRLLHWQDSYTDLARKGTMTRDLVKPYWEETARMLDDKSLLFPRETVDASDARMLLHPPGYSILLRALFGITKDTGAMLKLLQIIQLAGDALAAVLIFLIAAQLLPFPASLIAGLLVAFSPHLAYYSLWLSPDSLAVLPILGALYFLLRASNRPRLSSVIAAGALVGLSCWLRSNALLLAPLLAFISFLLFDKRRRPSYSLAIVCAALLVISPITIRNWVVYRQFIPLSLATGLNLIQGIAEFDKEGRFALPLSDGDAQQKDVDWHGHADYGENLWNPDGIERDRYRFNRGFEIVRSHPEWFLGCMLRRAIFMLRYNEPTRRDWPFYTSTVPLARPEATFCNWPASIDQAKPVWSRLPAEALAEIERLSPEAELFLTPDGHLLRVAGDDSVYDDQFAFAPLAVEKNTDYVLALPLALKQGYLSVRLMTTDRRATLASALPEIEEQARKKQEKNRPENIALDWVDHQPDEVILIPFSSGDRNEVRLVLSNNDATPARPVAEVGQARLFALGPTPYVWARPVRAVVHAIQKNLFTTRRMLAMVIAGVILVALAGRGRALLILLAIPAYYVGTHSAFSTEYRYILAIHYLLFVMAAVAIYVACVVVAQSAHKAKRKTARASSRAAG